MNKTFFCFKACFIVSLSFCGWQGQSAYAQNQWPIRPVRVVVPFSPGAFTDIAARAFAAELGAQLGQQFVIDNRTGAGGIVGMDIVAKALPDGYTLLITDNSLTITPALYAKLPYDAQRDLTHISQLAESPSLMVAAQKVAAKSVKEVIESARSHPGDLTYGSGGQGSAAHLAMELLLDIGKIKMTHVPFKGVGPSVAAVVAGQIDFSFGSLAAGMAYVNAGRIRGLALSGSERSSVLPAVPTFAEAGFPEYNFIHWWSIAAPSAVSAQWVTQINHELSVAARSNRLRASFVAQGARPIAGSTEQMKARVDMEIPQWRDIIKKAGIRLE